MPTEDPQIKKRPQEEASEPTWILHVDGASNPQGCGAGLILTNIDGMVIEYALPFAFKILNNQIKYGALIAGLKIIKDLSVKRIRAFTNS